MWKERWKGRARKGSLWVQTETWVQTESPQSRKQTPLAAGLHQKRYASDQLRHRHHERHYASALAAEAIAALEYVSWQNAVSDFSETYLQALQDLR